MVSEVMLCYNAKKEIQSQVMSSAFAVVVITGDLNRRNGGGFGIRFITCLVTLSG